MTVVYGIYRLTQRQILRLQGIAASKTPMKHMEHVLWTSRFKAFTKRKRRTQYKKINAGNCIVTVMIASMVLTDELMLRYCPS